ncbi:MAG: hypothetical protein KDB23_23800 [Planctomycetales bacterium]|nr:hypothetical protein [Planctomycetales bacterium]
MTTRQTLPCRLDASLYLQSTARNSHPRSTRVALYSHDTMGLGHMRRNLLLAKSLTAANDDTTVLMLAGAKEASAFAMPRGVDCMTLPAISKDLAGSYHSGHSRLPLQQLVMIRSAAIRAALESFQPDVLVVDKVPRGAEDELMPTLEQIRREGRVQTVLGLREILDDRPATLANWQATQTLDVIRDYFDAVWVYGDRHVFDLIAEYDMPPDVAAKVHFVGYLDQRRRADFNGPAPAWMSAVPAEPYVLCAVGGGQDGVSLARAFVEAISVTNRPAVLLTGPHMPAEVRDELHERAARMPHLCVLEFVPEGDWLISRAERVICMGGYNTMCSVMSFGKPALVVPRTLPRQEQYIRAQRLADLGVLNVLHPDSLHPSPLIDWIQSPLSSHVLARDIIDFDGLNNVNELVATMSDSTNHILERR